MLWADSMPSLEGLLCAGEAMLEQTSMEYTQSHRWRLST
jgi:hypothetical protein